MIEFCFFILREKVSLSEFDREELGSIHEKRNLALVPGAVAGKEAVREGAMWRSVVMFARIVKVYDLGLWKIFLEDPSEDFTSLQKTGTQSTGIFF